MQEARKKPVVEVFLRTVQLDQSTTPNVEADLGNMLADIDSSGKIMGLKDSQKPPRTTITNASDRDMH
jgi:hypothetical protein